MVPLGLWRTVTRSGTTAGAASASATTVSTVVPGGTTWPAMLRRAASTCASQVRAGMTMLTESVTATIGPGARRLVALPPRPHHTVRREANRVA